MLAWWFIRIIGCLYVGIIHCQDNAVPLADIEPRQDPDVQVDLSVNDGPPSLANDTNNVIANAEQTTITISTTISTPEPFSCHECINCTSKADFITRACETGITICYILHKRINNNTRIIRRGCSTSKSQCLVPDDDQTNTIYSLTCCTSHKCNQATRFKPLFFLLILSLIIIVVLIIHL